MKTDYLKNPTGEQLDWLIRQLKQWPTRVDESKTTNIEFLMKSAAAALERTQQLDEALRRFASVGFPWAKHDASDNSVWAQESDNTRLTVGGASIGWNEITVGDLRRAYELTMRNDPDE